MYEVAGELDDEKEELKEDLAVAEAKLTSTDTELSKHMMRCLEFGTSNSCYNNK